MKRKRTGVQLKDKWRNFIKYNKLSAEELENLPRRVSGPWSRKSRLYMATEDDSQKENSKLPDDNITTHTNVITKTEINMDVMINEVENQAIKNKY